jgi:dihydroorotate dehydrogenase
MKLWGVRILLVLAFLGILDAGYLTLEHFSGVIPPCSVGGIFNDCGRVLTSVYATPFGIPLALVGFLFYILEYFLLLLTVIPIRQLAERDPVGLNPSGFSLARLSKMGLVITSFGGFIMSIWFVYLQVIVLHALCRYCMGSAAISFTIFFVAQWVFAVDRKRLVGVFLHSSYVHLLKPILFSFDPEKTHVSFVGIGKTMGKIPLVPQLTSSMLRVTDPALSQTIADIRFKNPIGLAAGFDYEANLTQILRPVGFGFQSVGSITNLSYEGNPKPMLGRLPLSRSLLVNKGFKNLGAKATIEKLERNVFPGPVGISIGVTNTPKIVTITQALDDILAAYQKFEKSKLNHAYYELNISCPNVATKVSFYDIRNFKILLKEVGSLKLSRPVFVKMPIEQSKETTLALLDAIAGSFPVGVNIGNLAHSRSNPAIHPSEVNKYAVGNFSGKPTWQASNEWIRVAHKRYHIGLTIVGCGGVFTAQDAYEKIRLGASLVQLITGMIYQGPQLISQINLGLLDLLHHDGYTHISEAVGTKKG